MRRRAFGFLFAGLALSACTPPGGGPGGIVGQGGPGPNNAPPMGARVGLLLPLSGANAGLGHAMLQAAQLAVDAGGTPRVTLDPQDTAGTPEGAANAARQAIAAGDGMLVGPVTAPETAAAGPVATAASVPMLAFTSDPAQARPGIWTLGITPGQQVRRLVAAAQSENRSRFAAVLPDSPLGVAMADAMRRAAPDADLRSYPAGSTSALQVALGEVSRYGERHSAPAASAPPPAAPPAGAPGAAPIGYIPSAAGAARVIDIAVRYRGLNPSGDVVPGQDQGQAPAAPARPVQPAAPATPPPAAAGAPPAAPPAATSPVPAAAPSGPPPIDALLVAETGSRAAALGSMLSRDDLAPPAVRVLGPGLWQGDADRLGGLAGAWFAAPDPAARADFVRRYAARFGAEPPRLADLAYDAASLARVLAEAAGGQGFALGTLTRPEGFGGTDGVLALQPDGQVRRGLAVFEIQRGGGARLVGPSPTSLGAPGV
jgi:ABC-type branched-subunit amino acid transport system substrate-binding protein